MIHNYEIPEKIDLALAIHFSFWTFLKCPISKSGY